VPADPSAAVGFFQQELLFPATLSRHPIRQDDQAHIERLEARDRRVLEAANVAGAEFSIASVSAALG
jgi:hypothetical protein